MSGAERPSRSSNCGRAVSARMKCLVPHPSIASGSPERRGGRALAASLGAIFWIVRAAGAVRLITTLGIALGLFSLLPRLRASEPGWADGPISPLPPPAEPTFVREAPCPASRFVCITLSVPRDHFSAGGPRWEVTYALHRATGERLGTFVTITGGPGSSGIAVADEYSEGLDQAVVEHYDLVFLDQRGVGRSRPMECPTATATYARAPGDPTAPAGRAAVAKAAERYATDCVAESNVDRADLPFFSTRQAVEDLEAFRRYLGAGKIHLYGESYGTQYVQTYAVAHPDAVAALYLDGPVDLTTDPITFYAEQARAIDDVLAATLAHCAADPACRDDTAGGSPAAAYDALRARLNRAPLTFSFVTAGGAKETREFTTTDLYNAVVNYLYSPSARSLLERALTAASHGDLVPLARLSYDGTDVDPETLAARPDPRESDAAYFAVECQDYAFYPGAGDPAARVAAWVADAEKAGIAGLRVATTLYGDLPCLWWPAQPARDARPPPIVNPPYPTFVLTATLDPATPRSNAVRIYGRLSNAYFAQTTGGAHVSLGRGQSCPDQLLTDFLVRGASPPLRVTVCDGKVAGRYVANARPAVDDYGDGLALLRSMEDQITGTDEYHYRLDQDPITMGCDLGGSLRYEPVAGGTRLKLDRCSFTSGAPMTGTGMIDDETGTFSLAVGLPGGRLRYSRRAGDRPSVRGAFRGGPTSDGPERRFRPPRAEAPDSCSSPPRDPPDATTHPRPLTPAGGLDGRRPRHGARPARARGVASVGAGSSLGAGARACSQRVRHRLATGAYPHAALHTMAGDWELMFHELLFAGYDAQGSDRGASAPVGIGWFMGMARRRFESGTLTARLMLSPEPGTVRSGGYPLLLQTGETYKGQPLRDRQHPHDFFMEVGLIYTQALSDGLAVQIYAAPSGEPALGPVAYPHRQSATSDPLATLSHHWQDSTHISFGVLTFGVITRRMKLEGCWFNGREPDETRYDFDLLRPDSTRLASRSRPAPPPAARSRTAISPAPRGCGPTSRFIG